MRAVVSAAKQLTTCRAYHRSRRRFELAGPCPARCCFYSSAPAADATLPTPLPSSAPLLPLVPSTLSAHSAAAAASHLRVLRGPDTDPDHHGSSMEPHSADLGRTTHFGFETVDEADKASRVAHVFSSVADTYDCMNDLMSFGWHRVWKDHFVSSLDPGFSMSKPPAPLHILDVAGGTGDIAFRMLQHARTRHNNHAVRVTVLDINPDMLAAGRVRAAKAGLLHEAENKTGSAPALSFVQGDAERVQLPDCSVDVYTVAFGIRNFTNMEAALREAFRVLRPGGVFACLEFGKADAYPLFNAIYKRWSFGAIPLIGQLVAGDRDSYQYLVESIERFPNQERFCNMIAAAGFLIEGRGYEDLTGGVAAIHRGRKPVDAAVI